jgi:hypothetical protein
LSFNALEQRPWSFNVLDQRTWNFKTKLQWTQRTTRDPRASIEALTHLIKKLGASKQTSMHPKDN